MPLQTCAKTMDDFSQHMSDHFLSKSYDTYTRCRIVHKMLGFVKDDFGDTKKVFKEFFANGDKNSINHLRNTYAHTPLSQLEQDHSLDNCVNIRKELHPNSTILIASLITCLQILEQFMIQIRLCRLLLLFPLFFNRFREYNMDSLSCSGHSF